MIQRTGNDAYACGWSGRWGWYCVRTAPRREMAVAADLRNKFRLRAFVPVEIVKIRAGRGPNRAKLREIEKPFFPSYLFAQVAMDVDMWLRIRKHDHVCEILSGGLDGLPTVVPDAAMRHLIEHGPFREPEPQPGEPVKLLTGPFAGVWTKIKSVDRAERITVLVRFMGADRPVEIPLSDVERSPDGHAARRKAL